MPSSADRPVRLCEVCGGLDDHPRHVQGVRADSPDGVPSSEFLESLPDGVPASALAQLLRPTQVVRHLDCCAALGCVLCIETEAITKGARGPALIKAIDGGALADHEPPEITTNEETGLHG